MAGVGDKPQFGRSINPNLNQFSFFNSIGYLKMIKKCEIIPVLKQSVEHLFKKFYLSICKIKLDTKGIMITVVG